MRPRSRLLLVSCVALSAVIAIAAAAARPKPFRFSPLLHAERQLPVKLQNNGFPPVAAAAVVARSAVEANGLNLFLPTAARKAIDRVNFNRRIAIAVYLTTPSAGYRVVLNRVSLTQVGRIRQWCLRASITPPSPPRPQTGYVWSQTHVVTLVPGPPRVGSPSAPFKWVLRDQNGKLMSVSHRIASGPGVASPPNAVARGCPA